MTQLLYPPCLQAVVEANEAEKKEVEEKLRTLGSVADQLEAHYQDTKKKRSEKKNQHRKAQVKNSDIIFECDSLKCQP